MPVLIRSSGQMPRRAQANRLPSSFGSSAPLRNVPLHVMWSRFIRPTYGAIMPNIGQLLREVPQICALWTYRWAQDHSQQSRHSPQCLDEWRWPRNCRSDLSPRCQYPPCIQIKVGASASTHKNTSNNCFSPSA